MRVGLPDRGQPRQAPPAQEERQPSAAAANAVPDAVQPTANQGSRHYPQSVCEARDHILKIRQDRGFGEGDRDQPQKSANIGDLERAMEL
jgi:hypothetical protein